jgi:hypothetical protein
MSFRGNVWRSMKDSEPNSVEEITDTLKWTNYELLHTIEQEIALQGTGPPWDAIVVTYPNSCDNNLN